MRAEYKRDMSHNYLILQGDGEVDTSSYQVRMLAGNGIPSLLKCRLQGLDGKMLFYYEITSRQSVSSLFEQKKFGIEDLQLLFGGFVRVMEEMAEYLLNPGQLVLRPEYIFVDLEKRELFFCYLPGFEKEVREQFQSLTEYVLPKLDHEDSKAVMLGYGVYRRALEDCFHLEYIKEELYRVREESVDKEALPENNSGQLPPETKETVENFSEELWKMDDETLSQPKEKKQMRNILLGCGCGAILILAVFAANLLGYLPWIRADMAMGGVLVLLGGGLFIYYLVSKKKKVKPDEEEWKRKVQQEIKSKEETSFFEKESEKRNDAAFAESERLEKQRQKEYIVPENIKKPERKPEPENLSEPLGETVVLSANIQAGPSSLVSREPGELATIYLTEELTVIGKMETAADAVIPLPTVSRLHAKIRRRGEEYYLTDLNSRNGTCVNGKLLKGDEEYLLQNEDEVDFAQARYIFLK